LVTNSELAILALVAEKPCHGYEIEQLIEARGMREWTEIGFSSIYFLLNKLEKAGLVESRLEPAAGRGPARKVFQITQAGQQALDEELYTVLSTPRRSPASGFLTGLAYLPSLSPERVLAALEAYQVELGQHIDQLQHTWDRQKPLPDYVNALFEYTLAMLRAERDWIAGYTRQLADHQHRD
jgi:DNA-binding PadR family transcriptional regulator